ncbi:MAG: SH3 domain-containing protein [Thioclava marina]|jgi:Bacterial SH3 domain.|uniref:SH3 domain-containing protein n=1 Tax=Thioclava TaxID=285107 RepID=UPI0009980C83|nr:MULTISPECIES: SH3 domain-containing protein [Thioclava]TNE92798.1 MAG: SH3 domain-containing protein [Paracoccaceae bacterium]MBC7145634.1 SH3 domain-containing protein [Thioclava marina]MBD3804465.1 SH3 domain-containing protein [Thioclava sp.]OOY27715.1 hypothetical protein BMI90_10895 [Thioclava sp. L04-15]TNF14113.1 MAG: SH3 domain-containing protein [Paracoccaceae bacterium]
MGKLLITTLAGIYAVMAIGGRDLPTDQTQMAQAAPAPQEQAAPEEVAQAATDPLYDPTKITAPSANAAMVEKAALITRVTPVARMPGPALQPSPEYRSREKAPEVKGGTLWEVTANSLNVRSGPSTGDSAIDRVLRGEQVLVVAERDGWAHVKIEGDGIDGWVAKRYLSPAN